MSGCIAFSVTDDCRNFMDSWGEICVGCNCCGRFGKATMYRARIKVYRRILREELEKVGNPEYPSDLQQRNFQTNIRSYRAMIANAAKREKARKARRAT